MKVPGSYCKKGILFGALIGLGAPLGSLFFRLLSTADLSVSTIRSEFADHSFYYVYMSVTTPAVFAVFGYVLGILLDKVSEQKQSLEVMNVVLKGQSITDDMTGLYNHRHIVEEMDKEIERTKRYGRSLSCMMIDIDNFKRINDEYGHLVGDGILREMAYLLRKNIRKIDVVGRYGGDEFFVILPEADWNSTRVVAEKIQLAIRQNQFGKPLHFLPLTVSVGFAVSNGSTEPSRNNLIDQADQALLQGKRLGKNNVHSDASSASKK